MCADPVTEHGGGGRARRVATNQAAFHCEDPVTHIETNTTVVLATGKQVVAADESTGFRSFTTPSPTKNRKGQSTNSSTPRTTLQGTASTDVTTWDAKTGHITGTATLEWKKDKKGKAGSCTMAFDLILPPE